MRELAMSEPRDLKWVVLDGPVDALWIENMITMSDDNMMLRLANRQRIKLRDEMRLLLEVQHLAVASPAALSRCGMVCLTPEQLGWATFVHKWIKIKFSSVFFVLLVIIKIVSDMFLNTVEQFLLNIRKKFV
jgi:dynein heavy chain, axonemal